MPLFKEWETGTYGRAAIWKIEEPEEFFMEHTGVQTDLKNERRRIEHLAGRFLLKYLEAEFPLHGIAKDEHDKPRLAGDEFFFSISHSWPYVAAIVDVREEAGIDIQTWHPRVADIKHKYLSEEEQELLKDDDRFLTLAWSAKEAAYKWNGRRAVDFIKHLPIETVRERGDHYDIVIYSKANIVPKMIFIENIITIDFTCSYVMGAQDWAIY
jgi:phosphopantetheinyl transferase